MVLEDRLLSKFNPISFLKLLNHRLEEFKLKLFFLQFCFNLDCDFFFDAAFIHTVTGNLREQFHVSVCTLDKPTLVELLAKIYVLVFMALSLGVLLPEVPNASFTLADSPLLNPA